MQRTPPPPTRRKPSIYVASPTASLASRPAPISDLGAAVWLGLAGADRTKALVNRGLAYRAAGLTQQAEAEIALARKTGSSSEVEKLIAEDGGPAPAAGAVTAFSTEVRREGEAETETVSPFAAPAPAPAPSAPPPSTAEAPAAPASKPTESSSWSTSVDDGSAPAPSGGNRLTRWFSSVTGPSDAPQPPPPPSAETASQQSAPTTGWGAQTDAAPQARTRTADATPAATGDIGRERVEHASRRGNAVRCEFRRRLSAATHREPLRGRSAALWKKVSTANPQLAATQPTIEKTDIGGLGTFYRLQVGPFPDKAESLKLCNALKRSGVDCFLRAVGVGAAAVAATEARDHVTPHAKTCYEARLSNVPRRAPSLSSRCI